MFSKIRVLITGGIIGFRGSVKVKLTALFLIGALIPMTISIFSIYSHSRNLLQKNEVEYVINEINILTNTLNNNINKIENIIINMLLNTDILQQTNNNLTPYQHYFAGVRVNELLSLASAYSVSGQSFAFVSRNGDTYDNGTPVNIMLNINSEIIQYIISNGPRWTITARKLYDALPVLAITLGRPAYFQGSIIGVLLADIRYSSLDEIIEQGTSQKSNIYLFDDKRKLIYLYGSSELVPNINPDDFVNDSIVKENGTDYLCVKTVTTQNNFTSIALIPTSEIFSDFFDFNLHSYVIILIMLVESLVFAWFVSNTVSKNIIALSTAVEEFTRKNKPVRINIRSMDEIGRLYKGIEMMTNRIPELLQQVRDREIEKRHLEIKALMSQINPHMIYNTLNTITYLAQALGNSNIEEVSSSFARLLRISANIPGEFLLIRQEVDYIRSYINIKKYDLLFTLSIDIQVEEELMNCKIPKLILQPFIENSIVHGFINQVGEGRIQVKFIKNGDMLHISITDNGCGISEEQVSALYMPDEKKGHEAIGISNTFKRLKLYYDNNFNLEVKSDGHTYTTIIIDIPLSRDVELADHGK